MKIKKGDTVMVIAGKDKGKTGKVAHAYPENDQVVIEGVNIITRHQKNKQARSQGQIIERPAPIHASNVSLIEGKKPVRVGYKIEGEGKDAKKVRVSRKTGKVI